MSKERCPPPSLMSKLLGEDPKDKKTTPENKSFWQSFTKDIKPLNKKEEKLPPVLPPGGKAPSVQYARRDPLLSELQNSRPLAQAPSSPKTMHLLRRQRRRLHVEATLDLHGQTQQQAISLLGKFIEKSYQQRLQCLLVITGKGRLPEKASEEGKEKEEIQERKGVLKQMVIAVLNTASVRPLISGYSEASQKDGGSGALYVFLKTS